MNVFELLEDEASKAGIDVIDCKFNSDNIKGLYCNETIGINTRIDTTTEKACVLAEELGHHYTSVGNIIDMHNIQNKKQERQARLHGYNRMIGLYGIVSAFTQGAKTVLKLQSI